MNREERIEDSRFYHVYNRGNNRERIFGDDSDYEAFLKKIDLRMARYLVAVPIYCLMPNHFHMIVLQNPGGNLSDFMGALATSAAKRYNLKYGHIGHVFQGAFRFKPVPDDALWDVAGYIHLNPVKAGLAKEPDEWKFSNFAQMKIAQMKVTFIDDQSRKKVTFNPAIERGGRKPLSFRLDPLWDGYVEHVRKLLTNERMEKVYWKRVQSHVKGFLD